MKDKKAKKLAAKLDQVILDLTELTDILFLPHQILKLEKISEQMKGEEANTNVHGGGTGSD